MAVVARLTRDGAPDLTTFFWPELSDPIPPTVVRGTTDERANSVSVSSTLLARDVRVAPKCGTLSDNYVDLLPGRTAVLNLDGAVGADAFKGHVEAENHVDGERLKPYTSRQP